MEDVGLTFCQRWDGPRGFENFYKDMGPRPFGMSIDRKNNDKGYYPSNCHWTTPREQAQNRRPIDKKILVKAGQKLFQTMIKLDPDHQKKANKFATHTRWHVRRGLVNPNCKLCTEAI